jgi:hypothetical protein
MLVVGRDGADVMFRGSKLDFLVAMGVGGDRGKSMGLDDTPRRSSMTIHVRYKIQL